MYSSRNRRRFTLSLILIVLAGSPGAVEARSLAEKGPLGLSAPINGAVQPSFEAGSFWSLPICGPLAGRISVLGTTRRKARVVQQPKELRGGISTSDQTDKVGHRIDELLDAALERDPQTKVLDKAVSHYRTTTQKVIAETKDATDYLVPYRGFGPSSEAGDIILDEKVKLKSRASAEYARQKHIDETHIKVVSSVMQMAMGLGMSDTARGQKIVSTELGSLKQLVGEEEAEKTMNMLTSWSKGISVPETIYAQGVWDVAQRGDKFKTVIQSALDNDPIVHEIQKRLHKYNHRSNFARVSAHVVQTTLGVAALTPNFVGPAAKLALLTFVMATGGPESCKLLKELYLDKRFESRCKVLNEEAHLALDNYHVALLTRNPVLLACSESLVEQMGGPDSVGEVLGQRVLPQDLSDSPDTGDLAARAPAVQL